MANILFTFLGATDYQEAKYEFPSLFQFTGKFFGIALLQELERQQHKVDKLVVLGTSGSVWDGLVAIAADDLAVSSELRTAREANAVTAEGLQPFSELMRDHVTRIGWAQDVAFEIIPDALEKADQISLIETVARHVSSGDRITFDVTNGFRHFPLMGVLATIIVRRLRGAEISGIWYGAFDHPRTRQEGVTPAVRLDGLANLTDWLEALAAFDADGNYSRFSKLLKDEEGVAPRTAEALRVAGFREHIGRLRGAADKLMEFRAATDNENLSGGAHLFMPALEARASWAEEGDAYQHYRALAIASLQTDDLVRTARLVYEAALTRIAMHYAGGQDILDFRVRMKARRDLRTATDINARKYGAEMEELSELRHILVHSSYVDELSAAVKAALGDVAPCRRFLDHKIQALLPDDPKQSL